MKILQYVFNVPGYIISSVPGLSWLQAATNTRAIISAGLTRKEQVKKSIDLIKSSCSKLEGVDFIEGSYSDALTRSKKEVRYLVCYVHLDEHEDTKIFLDKIGDDLNEFISQNNALFWGCSFDCPEGTLAVSELMIKKIPLPVAVGSEKRSSRLCHIQNSITSYCRIQKFGPEL